MPSTGLRVAGSCVSHVGAIPQSAASAARRRPSSPAFGKRTPTYQTRPLPTSRRATAGWPSGSAATTVQPAFVANETSR